MFKYITIFPIFTGISCPLEVVTVITQVKFPYLKSENNALTEHIWHPAYIVITENISICTSAIAAGKGIDQMCLSCVLEKCKPVATKLL